MNGKKLSLPRERERRAARTIIRTLIAPEVLKPERFLEVGFTRDMREIIINHPDLQPDENGCGHIVFSPAQARHLARLLLRKADECKP